MDRHKHSRVFRDWQRRVNSWNRGDSRPTHSIINRYRNIYSLAVDGYSYGAMSREEAERLVSMIERSAPFGLTADHTEKGLTWVKGRYRELTSRGIDVDYVLGHFDRFTWEGTLHLVDNGWAGPPTYTPCWAIHLDTGERVRYAATPWQTGGIVEYWEEYRVDGSRGDLNSKVVAQ